MPYKDKENKKERNKIYWEQNKEKLSQKRKEWYINLIPEEKRKFLDKTNLTNKKWMESPENKLKHREHQKKANNKRRLLVLNAYSNNDIKCACCGENEINFMALDHINNDGAKHRKEMNNGKGGSQIYQWIINNNYPTGFQVLCHNCNLAKGFYGECPHVAKKT